MSVVQAPPGPTQHDQHGKRATVGAKTSLDEICILSMMSVRRVAGGTVVLQSGVAGAVKE